MNIDKETLFVKKFIAKNKQERLLFELSSTKKRNQAILRLSNYTIDTAVQYSGSDLNNDEIKQIFARKFDINNDCYVISDDSSIDGTIMSFKNAYTEACNGGSTYVLLCGNNVVFMKDEICFGAPAKQILIKE